ncbi:6844_t:CDS:2 [Funneliformis mosseae]|uniref:6844_t:CDS:1 n=1 Tax=Funneliformis mosseae TaxID=27381 RepID=A0A9N9HKC1_FUNMO|nr:6844_t:CDS:2 [Funneliformis mosseae]
MFCNHFTSYNYHQNYIRRPHNIFDTSSDNKKDTRINDTLNIKIELDNEEVVVPNEEINYVIPNEEIDYELSNEGIDYELSNEGINYESDYEMLIKIETNSEVPNNDFFAKEEII